MKFITGFAGDRNLGRIKLSEEPFRQFKLDSSVIHPKRLSNLNHFFEDANKMFIFYPEKENAKPRALELSSKFDTF